MKINRNTYLNYKENEFATHQPFLWHYLKKTKKPILELGAGYGSTPLLHLFSNYHSIPLTTIDTDWVWLGRFKEYNSKLHELIYVDVEDGWESYIDSIPQKEWGIILIDQASWQSRKDTAHFLKNKADYLIIHDIDALCYDNQFGKTLKPINNTLMEEGLFDFSEEFRYSRTFWPKYPWPSSSGPPTLIASMKYEIEPFVEENYSIETDVDNYLRKIEEDLPKIHEQ